MASTQNIHEILNANTEHIFESQDEPMDKYSDRYDLLVNDRTDFRYWVSDYALKRIAKNQNYMLLITGGTGCQPKGSKVLMADGTWKNIEEIKLGDLVLSPQKDGSHIYSNVLKTYEWESEICFQVVSNSNKILYECSYNHEIPHTNYLKKEIFHKTAIELWGKHVWTYNIDMKLIEVKIIPKNPKKSEIVYGFTLDSPSSWYITDNWMVTKNSGKSYSGIEIAKDIDPNFDVNRIVFTAVEFIDLLINKKLPPKSVILWDEVGVELSSRSWWSAQNRMMGFIFETFRRDNLILIMTTPNVSFIDKKIRSMLHGYLEMIDPTHTGGKFGRAKYYHIMLNLMEGKTYYMYPRTVDDFGRVRTLKGRVTARGNMGFLHPPYDITEPYEIRKKELVERVKQDTFNILTGVKEKTHLGVDDVLAELQKNPRLYKLNLPDDMITKTQLISHINIMIKLQFAHLKINKGDIKDAIEFVLLSEDRNVGNRVKIKEEEIDLIKTIFKMNIGNVSKTARAINVTQQALEKRIKSWKKKDLWDDKQILGEDMYEAKNSKKEKKEESEDGTEESKE